MGKSQCTSTNNMQVKYKTSLSKITNPMVIDTSDGSLDEIQTNKQTIEKFKELMQRDLVL